MYQPAFNSARFKNSLYWSIFFCVAFLLTSMDESSGQAGMPPSGSIATFASDCTTAQTGFCLGETVCAQAVGFVGQNHLEWYDASNTLQFTSTNQALSITNSFTPASSGTWTIKVIKLSTVNELQGSTTFIVHPLPTVTITASATTTVCAGTIVTLTAEGAVDYTWAASSS